MRAFAALALLLSSQPTPTSSQWSYLEPEYACQPSKCPHTTSECLANPNHAQATVDSECSACHNSQSYWPCDVDGLCYCWDTSRPKIPPAPSTRLYGGGEGLDVSDVDPCDLATETVFRTLAPKAQHPYSYEGFCRAVREYNRNHPSEGFANMGDVEQQKHELASFFGNALHESDEFQAGREYLMCADRQEAGGEVYCKPCDSSSFDWTTFKCGASLASEGRAFNNYCQSNLLPPEGCQCDDVYERSDKGPMAGYVKADQVYFGRGSIQLSWNYNYIRASVALTGAPQTFCQRPDLVAKNEEYAWGAGLFFWMENVKNDKTCHQSVLVDEDFGLTLDNINGGLECPADDHGWHGKAVQLRLNRYCRAATALGLKKLLTFDGCMGMDGRMKQCLREGECKDCKAWEGTMDLDGIKADGDQDHDEQDASGGGKGKDKDKPNKEDKDKADEETVPKKKNRPTKSPTPEPTMGRTKRPTHEPSTKPTRPKVDSTNSQASGFATLLNPKTNAPTTTSPTTSLPTTYQPTVAAYTYDPTKSANTYEPTISSDTGEPTPRPVNKSPSAASAFASNHVKGKDDEDEDEPPPPPQTTTYYTKLSNKAFSFTPLDDVTISRLNADTNYGSDPTIVVSAIDGDVALLRFDLSVVGDAEIVEATLRLTAPEDETVAIGVYYVETTANGWLEDEVTHNSAPKAAGSLYASVARRRDDHIELDVTKAVANHIVSFKVAGTDAVRSVFRSKESVDADSMGPVLLVTLGTPAAGSALEPPTLSKSPDYSGMHDKGQGSDSSTGGVYDKGSGVAAGSTPISADLSLEKGTISGIAWDDSDRDGYHSVRESGLRNVLVDLYSCDDDWIEGVRTDAIGVYKFDGLSMKGYFVKFSASGSGFAFVDKRASGVDLAGESACIELSSPNNLDVSVDAAMYKTTPPPTASPSTTPPTINESCRGRPCQGGERCRSKFGFCGDGDEYCNEASQWTVECGTSDPTFRPSTEPTSGQPTFLHDPNVHCSSEPCEEGNGSWCRSELGYCGQGDLYCNSFSSWVPWCDPSWGIEELQEEVTLNDLQSQLNNNPRPTAQPTKSESPTSEATPTKSPKKNLVGFSPFTLPTLSQIVTPKEHDIIATEEYDSSDGDSAAAVSDAQVIRVPERQPPPPGADADWFIADLGPRRSGGSMHSIGFVVSAFPLLWLA